ncbi:MAG: LON peptidase substrate-binding domain-containing protein [Acidobacteriota bacterium]|nr:LON peptidase substrate-binding domain-containing protein [Acidobacteriota bacterium]
MSERGAVATRSHQEAYNPVAAARGSDRLLIMSEEMDRVRGVRELPLFPLPIVLFPGVPLPLHIFEPRYRRMLDDIQVGNNFFGLSYFDSSVSDTELPPAGHIGCVAEVTETQLLPDGRSNILTIGLIRYRVEDYVQRGDPYLVAKVIFFEDEQESDEQLNQSSQDVAETFTRIARAVRIINDERASLPDISGTEPQRLSFLVAAAMEMDADLKQELLEVRFTSERLQRLSDMLARAVTSYEERARIHELAKGNGHGGTKVEIE